MEYLEIKNRSFLDLRYYIEQADIVVDQLRYQAFGSFARESMSMGKPVIGNVRPSLREHLPGLPLIDATAETLCELLETLALDPAKRKAAGIASRNYALEHFDLNGIARQLEHIYLEASGQVNDAA